MKKIDLIEPADGVVTEPLQKHAWPPRKPVSEEALSPLSTDLPDWRRPELLTPDRSFPHPVRLGWRRPPAGFGPLNYHVRISQSPDLENAKNVSVTGRTKVAFWHPYLGVKYYWEVRALRFGRTVAVSRIGSFTTNSKPPRWIRVPGITNVRDIGGWPLPNGRRIRQGVIYRGSEMNGSLQISSRGRRILQEDLGIRTDLDLRGADEASPALDSQAVEWVNIPISPYDSICDDAFKDGYRRIFEVLCDQARYPLIFHCVGGADRGGTVAFLLNALLGKSEQLLFRDYELTSLSIWGERSSLSYQFNGLLEALATFGGEGMNVNAQVEAYIRSIGVHPDAIETIRSQLME